MSAESGDTRRVERERGRLQEASSLHSVHWLVVGLSLLMTVLAWYYSKTQLKNKAEAEFKVDADKAVQLVVERLHKYEDALWGGVGAWNSHGRWLNREEWQRFSATLQLGLRYPGVNGIGQILRVEPARLAEFLAGMRQEWPGFKVKPPHSRPVCLVISYIEPIQGNRPAHGLDVAHEEERYRGAMRARDTGLASMTGPIVLVQDEEKSPGFLLYVPVYSGPAPADLEERKARFVGLVYAPVVVGRLMRGVLSKSQREVGLRIRDGETILYDELQPGFEDFDPAPLFRTKQELELYVSTWSFEVWSSLSLREGAKSNQPLTILFAGLTLDLLLLVMFWLLSRSNRRAIEFAALANRGLEAEQVRLRGATERLRVANEEMEHFVHVASHDLRSPLRAIDNLSKWISEDLESLSDLDAETAENLQLLRSRVSRMEMLLDGLLQFSRVGRKAFALQPVNRQSVEDLIQLGLGDLGSGFEVTCRWEIPEFETAKTPFEIVLRNLISNGIKHHDRPEGKVTVTAGLEEPGWVVVRVEDDGPGVPPEFRERIFGLFETLRPRDEMEAGGVGLTLVKKALDRYGGSIRLESGPDRGAIFVFKWPRAISPESLGGVE